MKSITSGNSECTPMTVQSEAEQKEIGDSEEESKEEESGQHQTENLEKSEEGGSRNGKSDHNIRPVDAEATSR